MMAAYSNAVLEKVADCATEWDRRYFSGRPGALEHFLRKEFRLLLQCLFVALEPDPLRPDPSRLEAWLELSSGLDVHDCRREILRRLAEFTGSGAFSRYASAEPLRLSYPDREHLVHWRRYGRELYDRSRKRFATITTDAVVDAELKLWPFYQAMELASRRAPAGGSAAMPDVFEESHAQVASDLAGEVLRRGIRAPRILEVGCGDGRLLSHLRKHFPDSEMIGTNIFNVSGVIPSVLKDPKIQIIEAPVESLPFEKGSFDLFVSTEVIEHLVEPEAMPRQARRILRPGGIFLVSAPSKHVQFLSRNPLTYLASLASLVWEGALPPFHNLYEPLTDLPLIHHGFSWREFDQVLRPHFPTLEISSMRFTHLRKFRLHGLAPRIPLLRRFGGVLVGKAVN